jgi:GH35 family endo-1,4-beta-xylanase
MTSERLKPFLEQEDYVKDRVACGIEQNRKGWFTLRVIDNEKKAVSGARVTVRQKSHEFKIGANLFALHEMESDEQNREYERLFADCFNLATLPFYWKDVEPIQGVKRYAKDSMRIYRRPAIECCLEFCEKYGIEPKAHCLDYDDYRPVWLESNDLSVQRKALYERFSELSRLFADRIPSWEVTNELLYIPGAGHSAHFYQPDMLEWDFRMADRLFPTNRLLINESGDNIWPWFNGYNSSYYMLIERALHKGCRIDSIGMQFHMARKPEDELAVGRLWYSPEHIYRVLDCYADLGLPIQITEASVPSYGNTEEDEAVQAEILKNLYSIWFSHPCMEAIVYWDAVDGYEWTPYKCGFIRKDLTPKTAYHTIRDLFCKTWRTHAELYTGDGGDCRLKAFYGDYEIVVEKDGKRSIHDLKLLKKGNKLIQIGI